MVTFIKQRKSEGNKRKFIKYFYIDKNRSIFNMVPSTEKTTSQPPSMVK